MPRGKRNPTNEQEKSDLPPTEGIGWKTPSRCNWILKEERVSCYRLGMCPDCRASQVKAPVVAPGKAKIA